MSQDESATQEPLRVGEKFRISAALLRHLYDLPKHESPLVELIQIKCSDGEALLIVAEAAEARK